jgi:hypothetical protein
MRENRPYGLEGGESGSTGLPYPYRGARGHLSRVATCRQTLEVFPSAVHRLAASGYGSA